jgi:hypothetical protein
MMNPFEPYLKDGQVVIPQPQPQPKVEETLWDDLRLPVILFGLFLVTAVGVSVASIYAAKAFLRFVIEALR